MRKRPDWTKHQKKRQGQWSKRARHLCWRSAKRKHQGEREKSCWYVSGCLYKKHQSETGNQRLREPHRTRSAKRTSAAEQKREQRTHANPQKQLLSLLSSCPPHQLTQLQQTSPMLSSTINLPIETVSQQGMPPGREGSRCLTRQKQVASYSRASVMTAATTTMLRAARVTRVTRMAYSPGLPRWGLPCCSATKYKTQHNN